MNVLMLGWEFPPYNVGGLGVACQGLAKGMAKAGAKVKVIVPKFPDPISEGNIQIISAHSVQVKDTPGYYEKMFKIHKVDSLLQPYMTKETYQKILEMKEHEAELSSDFSENMPYGKNLIMEVFRFAQKVAAIALKEDFDVIHAHDWMTFPAAIKAKRVSKKPFVIHIHNTAFDRSGGNPNPSEYIIERKGFVSADKIIAISNYVKNMLISKYRINPSKIEVVHNGIDHEEYKPCHQEKNIDDKIVLFAGRVTLQKGPDYFIHAAKKVAEKNDKVKFVLAGDGDMYERMINLAAEVGMSDKFIFTGKYSKEHGQKLMNMADVFVMPSVSEPFGLVPLEAMIQGTPTIISKQSGVSEVIANTLKVDFWDTHQLANKILALLSYPDLHSQIKDYGSEEVKGLTWDKAGVKCKEVFEKVKW